VPCAEENKHFEAYYKAQKICPEAEWDDFMACLRTPLPTSFRINGRCVPMPSHVTKSRKQKLRSYLPTSHVRPRCRSRVVRSLVFFHACVIGPGITAPLRDADQSALRRCLHPSLPPYDSSLLLRLTLNWHSSSAVCVLPLHSDAAPLPTDCITAASSPWTSATTSKTSYSPPQFAATRQRWRRAAAARRR